MPTRSRADVSATPATAASSASAPSVVTVGRLVGDRLLAALVDESRRQRPDRGTDDRQVVGRAGDVLARVAVSRQVADAVSTAMGTTLTSSLSAVYQYQPPGCEVRPHRDGEGYDIVLHLTVEHTRPGDGSSGSMLVVDGASAVELPPGFGVVLRGRAVEHQWTPLAADEHRTLVAVGFTSTPRETPVSELEAIEHVEVPIDPAKGRQ